MKKPIVHPHASVKNPLWSDLDRYCASLSMASALVVIILAPVTCDAWQRGHTDTLVYSGETTSLPIRSHTI